MDDDENALQALPKPQRFQVMVFLSLMWSTVFCVAIGSWAYWGELVIGHLAVALGVAITGLTFRAVKTVENTAIKQ
tara:strand:- start:1175 stop:1402 length:228 start_codon:yes stop_codon:yes gene_type:complete